MRRLIRWLERLIRGVLILDECKLGGKEDMNKIEEFAKKAVDGLKNNLNSEEAVDSVGKTYEDINTNGDEKLRIDNLFQPHLVTYGMTTVEKQEFIDRMRALSKEELDILIDIIPVDLCMRRIEKELKKIDEFKTLAGTIAGVLGE